VFRLDLFADVGGRPLDQAKTQPELGERQSTLVVSESQINFLDRRLEISSVDADLLNSKHDAHRIRAAIE
jgi:hypothetical protein